MSEASDDTSRILTQADALMNRHRSHRVFVARNEAENASPEDTSAPVDDDFPVLTEVVAEDNQGEAAEKASGVDHLSLQTTRLEETLEDWLDTRLPDEVLRVMDGISDQLISTLVTRMRAELLPQLMSSLQAPENIDSTPQNNGD